MMLFMKETLGVISCIFHIRKCDLIAIYGREIILF